MIGGMLAGTEETPGETIQKPTERSEWVRTPDSAIPRLSNTKKVKTYRGSASKESYIDQGKTQGYITPEGESFTVPFKGSAIEVFTDIEGGLRSAFTMNNASTLTEFQNNAILTEVTPNSVKESKAHHGQ